MKMSAEQIAQVCHEAGRGMTQIIGDVPVQQRWHECDLDMRSSCIRGVQLILDAPDTTPEQSHAAWCADRFANGWVLGENKSEAAKTHPALRPYRDLPEEVQQKDKVFRAIVLALR